MPSQVVCVLDLAAILIYANIVSFSGESIFWIREMRLVFFLLAPECFLVRIILLNALFYRCDNAIFGKMGRLASEETILQLIKTNVYQCLVYPLKRRDIRSLDFCVNRFLMKLFRTSDINVVKVCRDMFNFDLPTIPGTTLANRTKKFTDKYAIL